MLAPLPPIQKQDTGVVTTDFTDGTESELAASILQFSAALSPSHQSLAFAFSLLIRAIRVIRGQNFRCLNSADKMHLDMPGFPLRQSALKMHRCAP